MTRAPGRQPPYTRYPGRRPSAAVPANPPITAAVTATTASVHAVLDVGGRERPPEVQRLGDVHDPHRERQSLRPHPWPSPCTDTHPNRCVLSVASEGQRNTTYLSAAIDHRLPTSQPLPSIRRHQHNHTTPRPTPAPNRRPNRRFLYRCWIYPSVPRMAGPDHDDATARVWRQTVTQYLAARRHGSCPSRR